VSLGGERLGGKGSLEHGQCVKGGGVCSTRYILLRRRDGGEWGIDTGGHFEKTSRNQRVSGYRCIRQRVCGKCGTVKKKVPGKKEDFFEGRIGGKKRGTQMGRRAENMRKDGR